MSGINEKTRSILESYEREEEERKNLENKKQEELKIAVNNIIEESKPYWEARVLFEQKTGIVKEHKLICPECPHEIRPEFGKDSNGNPLTTVYEPSVYEDTKIGMRCPVHNKNVDECNNCKNVNNYRIRFFFGCKHVDNGKPCYCKSHCEILQSRYDFIKNLKDQHKSAQHDRIRKQEQEFKRRLELENKMKELENKKKELEEQLKLLSS